MASKQHQSKSRYLQTLLASTALVSGTVHAASPAAAGGDRAERSNRVIEEVVVRGVARKFRPDEQRSATGLSMALVETPQAVSVITPEMLETINADSAYGATDLVPGVQRSGFGFGLEQIVMRGIFNNRQRVNGILLGNDFTSLESFALDRLEIVRGPATVLYGVTGSFGGEINSILKQPLKQTRIEFGGEMGSYDSREAELDVTGVIPGTDERLSGRFVAKYEEYDLPLDIEDQNFPNEEAMILGAVTWDIAAGTTLTATWYHQQREMDPWDGGAIIENPDGSLSLPNEDPETWYFSHPDDSEERLAINFGLLELDHQFANGWESRSQLAFNKYDEELSYFYPFGPFGAYSLADDEAYIYTYDTEEDGEELTFNQSLGGDFRLLDRDHQFFLALEYSDNEEPDRFQLLNSFFQGFAPIDWFDDENYDGGNPTFGDGTEFTPITGNREQLFGIRQEAFEETEDLKLSAQLLLNPIERLELLLGALHHRNNTETKFTFNQGQPVTPDVEHVGFEETVYRVGATYDIADDWRFVDDARVYYSYSEGFEPQTFTNDAGETRSAPQEMTQHEFGLKAEMLGGSVGASIAYYDYEITNIQVSSSFLGSFGGFGSTVLEGKQEGEGVEVELLGEVLPGWNVSANYAYQDIEILDPNFDFTAPPRTTPEHSGAITTTYEFLDGPAAGLRFGATFKASDDYSFIEGTTNVDRFGSLVDGAHERLDIHASYAPYSGRLQNFEFWFNWTNVLDEDILVAKQGNPGYGIMFIDQQRVTGGIRYTFE